MRYLKKLIRKSQVRFVCFSEDHLGDLASLVERSLTNSEFLISRSVDRILAISLPP
jgi:hypothetical protein